MEFHAITPEGVTHLCSVHRGPLDQTPLQMISAQELARYRRIEARYSALLASLPQGRRPPRDQAEEENTNRLAEARP